MRKELMMCGHPELYPTQWEQKKPEPCQMLSCCACGENQYCPVCKFGFGAIPCSCERARETAQVKVN